MTYFYSGTNVQNNFINDDVVQKIAEAHEHMKRISFARKCLFRDGKRQIGKYTCNRDVVM